MAEPSSTLSAHFIQPRNVTNLDVMMLLVIFKEKHKKK